METSLEEGVSLEKSNKYVDWLVNFFIEKLPEGLTGGERERFKQRIERDVGVLREYVGVIYRRGFSLGLGLARLARFSGIGDYIVLMNGVENHLMDGVDQVMLAKEMIGKTGWERELIEVKAVMAYSDRRKQPE